MEIAHLITYESTDSEFIIRFAGESPRLIRQRLAIALGTAIRASLRSNAVEKLSFEQLEHLLALNFLAARAVGAKPGEIQVIQNDFILSQGNPPTSEKPIVQDQLHSISQLSSHLYPQTQC